MASRTVEIGDAAEPLADYARQVSDGQGPILVTAEGRPLAEVIAVNDESDLGQEETFAESLRRWAAMPEGSVAAAGPLYPDGDGWTEQKIIALLRKLPRTRQCGATSPKPVGRYTVPPSRQP
jgi:antitoxin (DNA-binding transcriptional repressor) of toxin-antitoxin stability system